MLQFSHPDYLWTLAALPVLAAVFSFLHYRRGKLLGKLIHRSLVGQLAPDVSTTKRSMKHLSLLLGLGFLLLSLADPQVGTRLEEVKREGIDLFVALDVSLSMKAEDIRPNRLEKAKRDVSNLLNRLQGDRVGLIVFAGDAFVQFPLTSDYSAADLFITAVDVDAVPTPGTRIAGAIELALKSFPTDVPTQKAIIIVTDGENNEGDVVAAVEEAKSRGVKVYSVGMGSIEGGPIPIYSAENRRIDYKRDRTGSIVLTKLDETTLQQLASIGEGSYRRATSGGNEIDDLFGEISELEKTEFEAKQVTGYESKYQYPLALAILFLLLEVMLSERRGTVLRWLKRLLPVAATFCAVVIGSSESNAQTHRSLVKEGNESYEEGRFADAEAEYKKALLKDPVSPSATFNVGDAYYKQQRYDEAARTFQTYSAMEKNPESSSRALYNVGNTLFKQNKFEESIEAYKQALRHNPNDDDARYNLELAKEKLKQQQQQQKKDQNKNQEQKQDQQQQQQKQDQQQKQNQDQQQQQQQNQQQNQQQQPQPQPQVAQQNKLPKEQADRILDALRNSEKEIQKQLRKREGTRIRAEKDW